MLKNLKLQDLLPKFFDNCIRVSLICLCIATHWRTKYIIFRKENRSSVSFQDSLLTADWEELKRTLQVSGFKLHKTYPYWVLLQLFSKTCFSCRLSLRKRQETGSSLTPNGEPGYEPGCQFHALSRESVFLFLPNSATVSFVLCVKNSAFIRSYRIMPPKSRATQRLLAHNVSPTRESRKRSRSEHQGGEVHGESSKGSHHKILH